MSVLFVIKWNIRPEREAEYPKWASSAIQRTLGTGAVTELSAYRPASGTHQVVLLQQFADMAKWSGWWEGETAQRILGEIHALCTDVELELWGESPVVPRPIRPGP